MTMLGAILTTVTSRHFTQNTFDAAAAAAQKTISKMNLKELMSGLEPFLGRSQEPARSLVNRATAMSGVNCQGVNSGADELGIMKCQMMKNRLNAMLDTSAVDAELYFPSVYDEHLHGAVKKV